jgi:Holliday junction resolvasome RuvABC DNA-binding subunit
MLLFSKTEMAERIKLINDLRNFEVDFSDEDFTTVYGNDTYENEPLIVDERVTDDSTTALQALGYKKKDAVRFTSDALKDGAQTVEDVIKFALRVAQREKNVPGT